jgi:endonuclease/exonuclease/phosphatase family metal-dependent hydrolase
MDRKTCTQDITLVNMNVWFGLDCRGVLKFGEYESGGMKAARFQNLTNGLKNLQPDVIGIQEANPLPDYIKKLSNVIGYDAVWKVTNSGIKIMGFGIPINFAAGNAILTKKPHGIKFLGSRRLSGMGLQTRYLSIHVRELRDVIAALVDIRDQSIIVFNTQIHYGVVWNNTWQHSLAAMIDNYDISSKVKENLLKSIHKSNQRRRQEISRLIDFVKVTTQKYDYPYIIMGDFNASIESFEMAELVTELGLLDTYAVKHPDNEGFTWNPTKNSNTGYDASPFWANGITARDPLNKLEAQFDRDMARRIDFIFLSYQFKPNMIKDADLVFNQPTNGLFTSDHFGLQVVLKHLPW